MGLYPMRLWVIITQSCQAYLFAALRLGLPVLALVNQTFDHTPRNEHNQSLYSDNE